MVIDREQELMSEIESAKQEISNLKQDKEKLVSEFDSKSKTIAGLEQAAASRDMELAALKQASADAGRRVTELESDLGRAVASYKNLVTESNPVLAELIGGNTIEEINESLKRARSIVDKVRQEFEGKISKGKIPAGAPQRSPLDFSGLSPREKITYAIGGKR